MTAPPEEATERMAMAGPPSPSRDDGFQPGVYLVSGSGFIPEAGSPAAAVVDLPALARALAASPLWGDSRALLVVRHHPEPSLAVIGVFDEVVRTRIEALSGMLGRGGAPLRYVGYAQAEEDCALLAARLRERFDPPELARFAWTTIPRGGLLVLGMLAYLLDLPPAALGRDPSGESTLVIVDDCALSGSRFRSFLEQLPQHRVVFAHLYSHPALRAAIEGGEEQVVACVSAHDLSDLAPDQLGDRYPAWQELWRSRSGRPYWVGRTEHLCFAWNEPDFTIWNRANGQFERAWRLLPGEACLKNRLTSVRRPLAVQVQPVAKGPLAPPAPVVFGRLGDLLVVGSAESGQAVALDGVAADMWEAIMAEGDVLPAAAALAGSYDVAPAVLHADLERFVEQATALGLLRYRRAESEG